MIDMVLKTAFHEGRLAQPKANLTDFFSSKTLREARAVVMGTSTQFAFDEEGKLYDKQPDSSPEMRRAKSEDARHHHESIAVLSEGLTQEKKKIIGAVIALLQQGISETAGMESASRLHEHVSLRIAMNRQLLLPAEQQKRPEEMTQFEKNMKLIFGPDPDAAHMRSNMTENIIQGLDKELGLIESLYDGTFVPPKLSQEQQRAFLDETEYMGSYKDFYHPGRRLNDAITHYLFLFNPESAMRFHNSHPRAVNFLLACNELYPSSVKPVIEVQDIQSFVGSVFLSATRAMEINVQPEILAMARSGLQRIASREAIRG